MAEGLSLECQLQGIYPYMSLNINQFLLYRETFHLSNMFLLDFVPRA
jgi:hypothetical protein